MSLVATQVKRRRGTGVENDAFAGAEGEITVDLTNRELRVHTGGGKLGGFRIGRHTDRTNCIIEEPNNINLEINNGQLVLKSGSKVYVPNGSGVFDEVVITNDILPQPFSVDDDVYAVYVNTSQQLFAKKLSGFVSGNTTPQAINDGIWYNTTANRIEWYNDSAWSGDGGRSFPIAIITVSNGVISSIDQIFNGFGYIGSTVFALPGVKGLAPNGRNADRTLKNIEITISAVQTHQLLSQQYNGLILKNNGMIECAPLSKSIQWGYSYDYTNNLVKQYYNGSLDVKPYAIIGSFENNNLKITSLTPKTPFHAVDYSDTDFIGHQAMPSGRYIDLTLGASGSSYTAPADGWFTLSKTTGVANAYLNIFTTITGLGYIITGPDVNNTMRLSVPVAKGDIIIVMYNMTGATGDFRFVYANGAQ